MCRSHQRKVSYMLKRTDWSLWLILWQEDTGHLRAVLSLLQAAVDSDPPLDHEPKPHSKSCRPAWCRCGCCAPSSVPHEELCCRRSDGTCITLSPLFKHLVLHRSLLEAVLLYRDPLSSAAHRGQTAALRHCAYRQYISWRFGVPPNDSHAVIPSCCVWGVREAYPSLDGQYSGFRPVGMMSMQTCANRELWQHCFHITELGPYSLADLLTMLLCYSCLTKQKITSLIIISLNWMKKKHQSFVRSEGENLSE